MGKIDEFTACLKRARHKHDIAVKMPEREYWQGVKDGLRKAYVILAGDTEGGPDFSEVTEIQEL